MKRVGEKKQCPSSLKGRDFVWKFHELKSMSSFKMLQMWDLWGKAVR